MEKLLQSIEKSISLENWYGALALSLTLPDICSGLENKPQGKKRYSEWFENYLGVRYKNFLSGRDCYALRCSFLHEGSNSIEDQRSREVLDKFVFLPKGSHCIRISQSIVGDPEYDNKSILQLSVERFCLDIIEAVKSWLKDYQNNIEIQRNLDRMLKIYENGIKIGGIFIKG